MVLQLDGRSSYVALPPNIFTNLTQATVEVWVKWDALRGYSRVFDFGAPWQSMNLFNHATSPDLRFNLYPHNAKTDESLRHHIRVNGLLRTNEWIHLAAVSGPLGMKLFANGVLVGKHTNTASFAHLGMPQTNYLGRGLVRNPTDQDFRGQIDEVRVWDHRRTTAQIREGMFKRLTGDEEGLVHLWNFDDATAHDVTPNAQHGKLMGKARIVVADLGFAEPAPAQTALPPATNAVSSTVEAKANPAEMAAWWIAAALFVIVGLLAWLVLMLRRSGLGSPKLLNPATSHALPVETSDASRATLAPANEELKERALAELTDFAKQSLVQGLYSQRAALLEVQKKALQELAELESRLMALRLPDRIRAYEKRIAELEAQLDTRNDELRELTRATLHVLRNKLQEERQNGLAANRLN